MTQGDRIKTGQVDPLRRQTDTGINPLKSYRNKMIKANKVAIHTDSSRLALRERLHN